MAVPGAAVETVVALADVPPRMMTISVADNVGAVTALRCPKSMN
jgi:hypothetical protein